jgi:hypothetical protein
MVYHPKDIQTISIKNGPPPKGHPDNMTQLWKALESTWPAIPVESIGVNMGPAFLWKALESTWAGIPVERFRHLVESMARRIEAILRAKKTGAI